MKYSKPEISFLNHAIAAIQSPEEKGGMPADDPRSQQVTIAAYAADE